MTGNYCAQCHRPTSISDSHDHGTDDMGADLIICTACKVERPRRWTDGPAVRKWMNEKKETK